VSYLTGNRPERELAIQLRMTSAYERSMSATVEREIRRALNAAADALAAGGAPGAALSEHRSRMGSIFRGAYSEVMPVFGDRILNAAGKRAGVRVLRRKNARGEFEERVQQYLATAGARAVVASRTTQDQIRAAIVAAEAAGLSQEELASQIRSGVPDLQGTGVVDPRSRSLIIARTEVHTASAAANEEAAKASGVVESKEWVSAEDDRTRPDHSDADGQTVGLEESFSVGPVSLQFPGAPGGPPDQVINCRCVVAYVTPD